METIIKILLLIYISILLINFGGVRDSSIQNDSASGALPANLLANSSGTAERQFKASLNKQYGTVKTSHRSEFILASGDAISSTSGSLSFSNTTLQESDVDESDRMKTDGQYIYVSSIDKSGIKIFKADQGQSNLVAELPITTLSDGVLLSGIYLRPENKQLIAMAGDGGNAGSWFSPEYWKSRKTTIFTIDISSPTQPRQQSKLTLDGQLISSRRIDNILYLATRHTVNLPNLIENPEHSDQAIFNRTLIAKTPMNDMLPEYEVSDERRALFDSKDCFYAGKQTSNYAQHSIISLLAIDLDDANSIPKGQCFIGDVETVYASANAIYLATTQYDYSSEFSDVIYHGAPSTEIHKFSLEGAQTDYVGSASISGHLGWLQSQKSFRMSEHNGALRVLSYVGERADSIESPARLHVLKEDPNNTSLDIIGTLPNANRAEPLGKKGEQIYASRFIGERAYLVTFRSTDPLYIIDISDPTDPYILSALELDGHSDHIQPIGQNFLLGIGKDAVAQTTDNEHFSPLRGAWDQGLKLSLIDIRNPSAPFEQQKIILGKRGTESAVTTTHHALTTLLDGDTVQVNVPVSLHDTEIEQYGSEPHPGHYFEWTQDALYRWNININSGEISTLEPIVAETKNTSQNDDYLDASWQHDRSAIIDGDTYYLKRDEILSSTN